MLKIITCSIIIKILDSKKYIFIYYFISSIKEKEVEGGGGVKTQL